jgi:hypothetical protein
MSDILQQRELMIDDTKEARLFDAQWGVREVPASTSKFEFAPPAAQTVSNEIESVEAEAAKIIEALPNYSVQHAGLEILHLFMVDLLGRNTMAAKIFKEKFGEEFADSRVVYPAQKYSAGALLVGLNAFFMYFILLKGVQKGQAWQLQYLVCALIQVVVDVLVFETTECIWLNFVVPRSVQAEVSAAAAIVSATAEAAIVPQLTASNDYFLNAPAHLFVSAKVAKAHPQLLESLIVRSYSSHLPGQICKTWPHYQSAVEGSRDVAVTKPTIAQTILTGAVLAVQVCLAVPYLYQRILLRFLQPLVFSAVSVMWFSTIRSPSSMIAMGSAVAACVLFYIWQRRAHRSAHNEHSVLPVAADQAQTAVQRDLPLTHVDDQQELTTSKIAPYTLVEHSAQPLAAAPSKVSTDSDRSAGSSFQVSAPSDSSAVDESMTENSDPSDRSSSQSASVVDMDGASASDEYASSWGSGNDRSDVATHSSWLDVDIDLDEP